ncbi:MULTISPECIES: DNA polymerase Y family protein [Oerskovia]|uniref:DNA polymerase Y family protein n=1 Tax=Oerskovia merdavium TaxID=2762227 RepID=A0ABR8U1T9_9CELL|nr:DNA polymerase Y family protein [Oerskovia merdavium]MBD7981799.1 DNA polymerase Y family protein [Oerskovia merdavium]
MSTETTATRTAVLWVPDWPVLAAMRAAQVPAHVPAATHDGRRVLAVSATARAQGVRRGMRRRRAQECCPEIELLDADDGRDAREFEPVALAAETVVAGIEVARPGLLLLPSGGPARYHGTEERLAQVLVERVAQDTGHESQVGVADGILAAVLAARASAVVPAGTSRAYLAPRPLGELAHVVVGDAQPVAQLVDLLGRLGLRTFADLAALPAASVRSRFGDLGAWAQRLAQGEDLRPPARRRIEADVAVECELDPPAERVDVATFAARRLAEDLHAQLVERSSSCGRLRITARTEDGRELERTWRCDDGAMGGLTAARITDRVRWQLEGWLTASRVALGQRRRQEQRQRRQGPRRDARGTEPDDGTAFDDLPDLPEDRPSPLVRLAITAEEVVAAGVEQPRLWGASSGEDARAQRALGRVQGLLGGDGVLSVVTQGGRDVHDQVHLAPWGDAAPAPRRADLPWPGRLPEPAPALVLDVPEDVTVLDDGGAPVRVDVRLAMSAPPATVRWESGRPRSARVLGWAGPWPLAERWWSQTPRRRAYLQVLLDDGRGVLLASAQGRWTVEAVYD